MSHFVDFSILKRNANYRRIWLGQFVSFFGTMITSVALPYQIYHLTHSTLMIGLLSLCQLLPLLFTALYGGVLADRHHRRTLLLIAESLLALGCLLLAINSLVAEPQIWAIFVIATIMSAITGLHRPALDSLMQQIVPKQDMAAMGGLVTCTYSVGMIAGPALGGVLIAHLGLSITFFIDFATFIFSLGAIILIRDIPKPITEKADSVWQSLKEGVKYSFSRQELLGTYFVDFVAMIFGMPMALFPAIAEHFGGPKTLGLLYAAPAIGALVISLVSGWTAKVTRHGVAVAVAATIWGIAIIFFGLSHNLWLALFFLAIAGGADAVSGIFRQLIWNHIIPTEIRGRTSGVVMISYLSGPKLGDTEAGLVAAAFGVTASVVSGGVLCVIGVGVCCYFLPKFWRYQAE
jgi:MFS family permease